ncbi:sugar-binding transcriptional regulator [Faecalimonas sp.]
MKKDRMTTELLNEYGRVAYYYYKGGLTQNEISKKMNMSRQRVNRILSTCIDLGIVKISIEDVEKWNLELEVALEKKYGLCDVRIVSQTSEVDLFDALGDSASEYLKNNISNNDIIGLTRGCTISRMVERFVPDIQKPNDIIVTQLMGNTKEKGGESGIDKMVFLLADKLNAKEEFLYAPVIVGDSSAKKIYMQDPFCKSTYHIMKNCSIAVVGIGTAHSQWKHMVALYDDNEAREAKWAENVVGEVCTHFYDKNGKEVMPPFRDRIISIALEDYKNIPIRIGVAGGVEKAEAIRGAIIGKYINVLITDEETAKKLL